ncbi:MAG TPA: hypothetical protein DCY88_07980 [Cyanobacteria bacterium UBA11372]|nr:hypothetical protein [Cyanobacteria bacterium UBA11372]
MSNTILESLVNGAGSIVASFSVALGLATLSTINNVSHEVVRLQEQIASVKSELSDIRNDVKKDLEAQEEQIKGLKERLDRIENRKSQVSFRGQLATIGFQQSTGFTCRVCRENGGCRVTNCSEPHYAVNS